VPAAVTHSLCRKKNLKWNGLAPTGEAGASERGTVADAVKLDLMP